jgi:hypothetical protein
MSHELIREIVRAELHERLIGLTDKQQIRDTIYDITRRFANATLPPHLEVRVIQDRDDPYSVRCEVIKKRK